MATPKISTASKPAATFTTSTSVSTGITAGSATVSAMGGGNGVAKRNRLPWLFGSSVALSLVALSVSLYLSYVAFTSSKVAGCGGGLFDCDHVLHSQWSTFLGLPVATWASSLYLSVLAALLGTCRIVMSAQPSMVRQWAWSIVTTAGVAAGLAALWFIFLQVFVLEHLCPWCLGAHTCGLLLCLSTLLFAPIPGRVKALCSSLGFIGTLGLVVIQVMTPKPPTFEIVDDPSGAASAPADAEMFNPPSDGEEILLPPDASPTSYIVPGRESAPGQETIPGDESTVAWRSTGRKLVGLLALAMDSRAAINLTGQLTQDGAQSAKTDDAAKTDNATGAEAEKPEERKVHLSGANVKLRVNQWPLVGPPTAKHVFVELFDYTCPHCRATHRAIKGAREKLKDDLAVIVLPVPLSRKCNDTVTNEHSSHRESCEIAQIALAVWKVDASKFPELHEWLMTSNPVPTAAAARSKAAQLVAPEALEKEMASASKFIRIHVDLYRRMGAGPVPKLVFPSTVITGEYTSAQGLIDTLNRQPPAAGS